MLKLTSDHKNYEVWCECTAESVFMDHKPTTSEIEEIRKRERWPEKSPNGKPVTFVVSKIRRFYTTVPEKKKPEKCWTCEGKGKTDKCSHCHGAGMKSDDSYSSFPCPWCDKGRVKTVSTCSQCNGSGIRKPWNPL